LGHDRQGSVDAASADRVQREPNGPREQSRESFSHGTRIAALSDFLNAISCPSYLDEARASHRTGRNSEYSGGVFFKPILSVIAERSCALRHTSDRHAEGLGGSF
jgi:hypothetical protein